jgi:hypothetical protein
LRLQEQAGSASPAGLSFRRRKPSGLRKETRTRTIRIVAAASKGVRSGRRSDLPIVGASRIKGALAIARHRSGRRRRVPSHSPIAVDGRTARIETSVANVPHPRGRLNHSNGR